MTEHGTFNIRYDGASDVLYIATRKTPAARGTEDECGILRRYDAGGDLIGMTIMDIFDRWRDHRSDLAQKISVGFHISHDHAERVLAGAFLERQN